jgi:hypothetical protein
VPQRSGDHEVQTREHEENFQHDCYGRTRPCEQQRACKNGQATEHDAACSLGWRDVDAGSVKLTIHNVIVVYDVMS